MFSNPSPGVARAIAHIDDFLAELRARRAATRSVRGPRRQVCDARRRLLRQLARPGRN
ncbi:MAG TPA: hypothetical protein VKD90_08355 [Gemmataceae bacterium]|nr:hypothetical protein [Gemmataceae bacterium]